jgi:hypothetical protein
MRPTIGLSSFQHRQDIETSRPTSEIRTNERSARCGAAKPSGKHAPAQTGPHCGVEALCRWDVLPEPEDVALVMLQGFAASGEVTVRDAVARRYLALQDTVAEPTGADALHVRSFIATGLVVTVSTVLALPGKRTDARWGPWLLELAQEGERETEKFDTTPGFQTRALPQCLAPGKRSGRAAV